MDKLISALKALQAEALNLLQGEPVRVIVYGSAATVFVVGHIAAYLGNTSIPEVSFDTAVGAATIAAGTLAEFIRRFVFSPNTVAQIVAEATAAADIPAAPPVVNP